MNELLIEIICIYLAIICYFMGFIFPDVDLRIPKLGHRSIVTHTPIFISIFYFLKENNNLIFKIAFNNIVVDAGSIMIASFSLGMMLHLAYDLTPKRFIGTALLKYPFSRKETGLNKQNTIMILHLSILILSYFVITYITYYKTLVYILVLLFSATLYNKRKSENATIKTIIIVILSLLLVFIVERTIPIWKIM